MSDNGTLRQGGRRPPARHPPPDGASVDYAHPAKFGRNGDVNLRELVEVDFPVHVRVDTRAVAGTKREAGAQHASQGGGVRGGPIRLLAKLMGEREEFMQAYPAIGAGFRRKADLFEGI